jgi:hypothetical protein
MLGGAGYSFGLPLPTCLLSGGLCGMAGMLPDIDSDTSRSFQECIYLAAGIAAVLTVHRLQEFGFEHDILLLGGAFMFLFVRFGVGEFVKKTTTHRGMFHSIPAAFFAGEIVFFLSTGTIDERIFKASALTVGYLSHLMLDEICSVDSNGRLKKSSGTALKFYDTKKIPGTLTLYVLVISMGIAAFKSPGFDLPVVGQLATENPESESGEKWSLLQNELQKISKSGQKTEQKTEPQAEIQREAAEYLAKVTTISKHEEKNPPVLTPLVSDLPVLTPPPVLRQVAAREDRTADWDSERRLFSRNRRAGQIPVDIAGTPESETKMEPLTMQPPSALLPLPDKPIPADWQMEQEQTPPSPMRVSVPVFDHNNYRHFALPNREPAPIALP